MIVHVSDGVETYTMLVNVHISDGEETYTMLVNVHVSDGEETYTMLVNVHNSGSELRSQPINVQHTPNGTLVSYILT